MRRHRKGWGRVERLDELCRSVTFQRDGCCQKCGSHRELEWCHIRSRRYHSTRWCLQNVLILCADCHRWSHAEKDEFASWFKAEYPERANWLLLAGQGIAKVDHALIERVLRGPDDRS